ncbi:hypothetical protein HDE_13090 [Halotydeus destructor]|nr:hypothetical protein HDE_13090 [Halotydeus destructor]
MGLVDRKRFFARTDKVFANQLEEQHRTINQNPKMIKLIALIATCLSLATAIPPENKTLALAGASSSAGLWLLGGVIGLVWLIFIISACVRNGPQGVLDSIRRTLLRMRERLGCAPVGPDGLPAVAYNAAANQARWADENPLGLYDRAQRPAPLPDPRIISPYAEQLIDRALFLLDRYTNTGQLDRGGAPPDYGRLTNRAYVDLPRAPGYEPPSPRTADRLQIPRPPPVYSPEDRPPSPSSTAVVPPPAYSRVNINTQNQVATFHAGQPSPSPSRQSTQPPSRAPSPPPESAEGSSGSGSPPPSRAADVRRRRNTD